MLRTSSFGRPSNPVRGPEANGADEKAAAPPPAETTEPQKPAQERAGDVAPGPDPALTEIPIEADRTLYLRVGKRALDLAIGCFAGLLLLPLFLVLAAAIKLDTPGPVLYRSVRVGRAGRPFTFYKLRSMIHGAEQYRHRLSHLNEVTGPVFKIAKDPRITKIGRFLRRTSLDELPQILNVIKGDMSLVGPRPPIPDEVRQYEPWQLRRLSVRPGITCLWQISGRSRLGFDEWMRLDMEYIDRRGFSLDLKILFQTLPAVLKGEGAY